MQKIYGAAVLTHFGLSEKDLLGAGSESRVYRRNDTEVLRIFAPNTTPEKIDVLQQFYACIDVVHLPVQIPVIHSIKTHGDLFYSIEDYIPGSSLSDKLSTLTGTERKTHLRLYVQAVGLIADIHHTFSNFGEVNDENPMTDTSWAQYLIRRTAKTLQTALPNLVEELPAIHTLIEAWQETVTQTFEQNPQPVLVHGDYFPGNVMVNDAGEVTAIIDFSPMTVIGDQNIDIAGALFFLEVCDGYQAADSAFVQSLLEEYYSLEKTIIELYRIYYSLYFSFTQHDDPATYQWCLQNLRAYQKKLGI